MPTLQETLGVVGANQLENDPRISNSPLRSLLIDPTFYQWFKSNFPDEEYPPQPNRMREFYDTYVASGGTPNLVIDGHDVSAIRSDQVYDRGQAKGFNDAMHRAFGGNPPVLMNAKQKGFINPIPKTVRDVFNASRGPLLGGPKGPIANKLGITGKEERVDRFPLLTPMQEKATNQLLREGMKNTAWGPIEQQARENFYTKTIPTLAERFETMGGGNQRTGAFAPAMASAGGELERGLAGLKSQFGMQQLGYGLQPRAFENVFRPGQPGLGQQVATGAAQFLPYLAMKAMGI